MTQAEDTLEDFLIRAKEKFGFERDEVVAILKKKGYGSFRTSLIDVYMSMLQVEWNERDETQILEEEAEKKKNLTWPVPAETIPCPICGAKTVGDNRWNGKYTNKAGWRCTRGGVGHFLQAKAGEIRTQWEAHDHNDRDTNPTMEDSQTT